MSTISELLTNVEVIHQLHEQQKKAEKARVAILHAEAVSLFKVLFQPIFAVLFAVLHRFLSLFRLVMLNTIHYKACFIPHSSHKETTQSSQHP